MLIMIFPDVFMLVALEGLIINWDFYWVLYECVSLKICSVQEMTKTSFIILEISILKIIIKF